jgi:hypothetical protein
MLFRIRGSMTIMGDCLVASSMEMSIPIQL